MKNYELINNLSGLDSLRLNYEYSKIYLLWSSFFGYQYALFVPFTLGSQTKDEIRSRVSGCGLVINRRRMDGAPSTFYAVSYH